MAAPVGRIRNTRKLLATAALIMSVMLMLSSFVTTLLVPEEAYREGGKATGRAIAYLAHGLLGDWFGTVYDVSTILILWFAGASAMAGLLHLIPRFLPRFGMAPQWVAYPRPLVLLLFTVCVIVTLVFKADVEAQGGAYATGVLVLMLSAAIAAALALWREGRRALGGYCWAVAVIFAYTLADNVHERPDGIIIASIFITVILVFSAISRLQQVDGTARFRSRFRGRRVVAPVVGNAREEGTPGAGAHVQSCRPRAKDGRDQEALQGGREVCVRARETARQPERVLRAADDQGPARRRQLHGGGTARRSPLRTRSPTSASCSTRSAFSSG